MKRALTMIAVMIALTPVLARAQGQSADHSPIPQQWMTLDSLGEALGLTTEKKIDITPAYNAINDVLASANSKRNEYKNAFRSKGKVKDLTTNEQRDARIEELQLIRDEYEARQANLEQKLGDLRGMLTSSQQTVFDALPKPRLVPAGVRPRRSWREHN